MEPDQAFFDTLCSFDTPTVLNAIEVVQGKRGYDNYTHETLFCADVHLSPIVGYAKTARIKGAVPTVLTDEMNKKLRMDYYRYVYDSPRPAVVVIEDTDWPNCVGAYWGEVNNRVHSAFGLSGAVTNGVMRDLNDLAPDFQVLAGSVKPSHAFVHIVDYGKPVNIMNMRVAPSDIIHADRHGAIVIPQEVIPQLLPAISKLLKSEALIIEPAKQPNFDFKAFESAWDAFEKSRV